MQTLLSWSSGKDSAWALHLLRQQPDVDVVGLVTTVNAAFDRVAMHGVRRTLVEAQAEAAGLPLHVLAIPHPCPNAEYERVMGEFVARQVAKGIQGMAFGDLFLEDIRRYREAKLTGTGLTPLFPLWGIETTGLARTMIDGGLEAYLACIDPRCWRNCRRAWTPARRTANSTPSPAPARCFVIPLPWTSARPSPATASSSAT
jgi:diphthamide synthase (EF-2-diphthine--ammonia ligase)